MMKLKELFGWFASEKPLSEPSTVICSMPLAPAKPLPATKVTPEQIQELLDSAETEEHIFWNKQLVVSYRFKNGFTVLGSGACVDPNNFDLEIGRAIARAQVECKLWELEGYKLQEELFQVGIL